MDRAGPGRTQLIATKNIILQMYTFFGWADSALPYWARPSKRHVQYGWTGPVIVNCIF